VRVAVRHGRVAFEVLRRLAAAFVATRLLTLIARIMLILAMFAVATALRTIGMFCALGTFMTLFLTRVITMFFGAIMVRVRECTCRQRGDEKSDNEFGFHSINPRWNAASRHGSRRIKNVWSGSQLTPCSPL
jgi:hypothetical protein